MNRIRMIGLCFVAAFAVSAVAAASASAGKYILALKDSGGNPGAVAAAEGKANGFKARFDSHALNGYAAPFSAATASAIPWRVQYGSREDDFALVHSGGPVPLLVMHEAGLTYKSTERIAEGLSGEGFTTVNLEWQECKCRGIWGFDTAQVEKAVRFVQSNAEALNVDAAHLTMLGGSRGANLALLTSLNMNIAEPGTVKAIAALSGDVDPAKQIERGQRGELADGTAKKLSKAYDCEPVLVNCPAAYLRKWSPIEKASASAPAMFLAASQEEHKTASLEDQYEMAARLEALEIPSEVFAPIKGHGYSYWPSAHPRVVTFLLGHT